MLANPLGVSKPTEWLCSALSKPRRMVFGQTSIDMTIRLIHTGYGQALLARKLHNAALQNLCIGALSKTAAATSPGVAISQIMVGSFEICWG